jgi:hypothetical protein
MLARSIVLALLLVLPLSLVLADEPPAPTVVGTAGNEPIVRVATNGTVYVSALQHLYRSTNGGASFVDVSPPFFAKNGNLASDSTIEIAPDGNTLYMAFNWPYAGISEICMTTDQGATWLCNPFAVPGGTDRQWLKIMSDGRVLLSDDVGLVAGWMFASVGSGAASLVVVPTDGPNGGFRGDFTQGWGATQFDDVTTITNSIGDLMHYDASGKYLSSDDLNLGGTGLPTTARDAAGNFYGLIEPNAGLTLARRLAGSGTVDHLSVPVAGKARLAAVAAGPAGKISVSYYGNTSANTWAFFVADTMNADAATPTWNVHQLSTGTVHSGVQICWNCTTSDPNPRFSGDFLDPTFDANGNAWWVWMDDGGRIYTTHQ